jgi:nucleotidyltransferase substrate binding protein (TIGR01987 family)
MKHTIRWKQRFSNLQHAFAAFEKTQERYKKDTTDEIVQMALVQAFEFTYELSWKTMKDYLEYEGFGEFNGSKQVIRAAFQAKIITHAEIWMEAVSKRNLASHTYNQKILDETVLYITEEFFPLMQEFCGGIKKYV